MSYDAHLESQTYRQHEREDCAERASELEVSLWASNYLVQYFGIERAISMYKRIGLNGCIDIAEAISEVGG